MAGFDIEQVKSIFQRFRMKPSDVLGLDIASTGTKAVRLRKNDDGLRADTSGHPLRQTQDRLRYAVRPAFGPAPLLRMRWLVFAPSLPVSRSPPPHGRARANPRNL